MIFMILYQKISILVQKKFWKYYNQKIVKLF